MITKYEKQYMELGKNIYNHGYIDGNCRQGIPTKRLPNKCFELDNIEEEAPILQSKAVQWKSAIQEILWIMQARSNNIHDLKPHIWDKWADENGSIGKSYGYQVGGRVRTEQNGEQVVYDNQVQYVLDTLEKTPTDRRCLITLWNREELSEMSLNPCCHTTTWNLDGGKLNCLLDQRSGDFPVGVPFNTFQYSALMMMFAKSLNVPCGSLLHVIADAHIYSNQMEGFEEQIANYDMLLKNEGNQKKVPVLKLNYVRDDSLSAYENFMRIRFEDFELVDYENMGKIAFALN